jgi:hypothetical protein
MSLDAFRGVRVLPSTLSSGGCWGVRLPHAMPCRGENFHKRRRKPSLRLVHCFVNDAPARGVPIEITSTPRGMSMFLQLLRNPSLSLSNEL